MILIFYNSSLMRYDLHLTGNSYSAAYWSLYHNLYLAMNQCMKVSWCQCVLWHAINQSRSLVIQSIQYHVLHNAALHNAVLHYPRILFSRNSNLQNITIHAFQKYHVDALSYSCRPCLSDTINQLLHHRSHLFGNTKNTSRKENEIHEVDSWWIGIQWEHEYCQWGCWLLLKPPICYGIHLGPMDIP